MDARFDGPKRRTGATNAASRRSKRLFRITPEAERQFLEDISRAEVIATTE